MGKDSLSLPSTTKRAAALGAAVTWCLKVDRLRNGGSISASNIKPLATLQETISPSDPRDIKSMIVDLDGQAVALEYVRENLLVGILGFMIEESTEQEESEEEEGSEGKGKEVGKGGNWEKNLRDLEKTCTAMAQHLRVELKDFKMPEAMLKTSN